MATHSSILAWEMPMDGEAWGGYRPWGRKESDYDRAIKYAQHRVMKHSTDRKTAGQVTSTLLCHPSSSYRVQLSVSFQKRKTRLSWWCAHPEIQTGKSRHKGF